MRTITRFVLTLEERQALKNVVDTVNCESECDSHKKCPFLMENGGCIIVALEEILDEQEREDF